MEAVRSVLAQDLGSAQIQIAIVDDASVRVRPAALLTDVAPAGRIELYEHAERLGLAGNWNRAIALARGEFVHILHQDDLVAAGFYDALLSGMRKSRSIGMAFCRHAYIDENGLVERVSHRERWKAGVLPRWLGRIAERQRLQCPAAIVRRDVYEALGGFRRDLRYALDWEMWVRIAASYEVWYEPRVLASYRRHRAAATARLESSGDTIDDMLPAITALSAHLPLERRARLRERALRRIVRSGARRAAKLIEAGAPELAARHLKGAQSALAEMSDSLTRRWLRRRLSSLESRLVHRTPVC